MTVRLVQVTKAFGGVPVIRPTSLDFRPGEVTALLGPSGSGKTTLLNMIAGVVEPDAGSVFLDDREITRAPVESRRVGYVFQSHALFPHLTVAENIEFALRVRRVARAPRRQRAETLLELVGMPGFQDRRIDTLSGGQKQRVAIARALAADPAILLMDEPLSALDPELRYRLRQELRQLLLRLRIPTVLVTHDRDDAFVISDRVVLMLGGSVIQDGQPEAVYHSPASEEAARLLGPINRFPDGSGKFALCRPEELVLTTEEDRAGLGARVDSVLFLGAHWRVTATTKEGEQLVADLQEARTLCAGSSIFLKPRLLRRSAPGWTAPTEGACANAFIREAA